MSYLALIFVFGALVSGQVRAQSESPLARQPALLGGLEAMRLTALAFEQANGRPIRNEFVGFSVVAGEERAEVRTLIASGAASQLQAYACLPGPQCEAFGAATPSAYRPRLGAFTPQSFTTSATEALKELSRARPNALIVRAKFWQSGDYVQVSLSSRASANAPELRFFASCHVHGTRFDCHSQSRPGPNEPQD